MIRCQTLGPLHITVDGDSPPPELTWRKNAALLVYLARSPHRTRTREHLCGLLWGEKAESAARHSLNEALRVLRRCAGDDVVHSEGRQVELSAEAVRLDTEELEDCLEREEWEVAAGLVAGPFLDGFGVPDASGFEDWLTTERRLWQRHSVHALARFAEHSLARGDVVSATRAAGDALALDPISNAAIRTIMRASALMGERATALETYDAFAARLHDSLAVDPEPETTRLADRIRRERTWRLPEALTAEERASRRPPLMGRGGELEQILGIWSSCLGERRAAFIALEGEPGVGKTRLAEEVAARARLDGGTVIGIRAVPVDTEVSWSGLVGICRGGLIEAPGLLGAPAEALAAVAAEIPDWGERFAAEIEGAEPMPLPRAFSEILRPVAEEQPLFLFVDDAEWLDAGSRRALAGVLRDLDALPCTVFLTVAGPEGRELLDELRSQIGGEQLALLLSLGPLEAGVIRRLAAIALPEYGDEALDRLTRRIEADSAGLPLLAVELLNAVRLGLEFEDGSSAWPQTAKTLDQTMPGDLPEAVVSAIRVGFRRLSSPAQQVLAAASVLAERVDASTLSRATGLAEAEVVSSLDELEWHRWLCSEPRGYAFVARVVQRVVATDMLTPGQRQRIEELVSSA
jgi:DNA-binding SARP family transcriptional activator